jgi:hypothetical protein
LGHTIFLHARIILFWYKKKFLCTLYQPIKRQNTNNQGAKNGPTNFGTAPKNQGGKSRPTKERATSHSNKPRSKARAKANVKEVATRRSESTDAFVFQR